MKQIVTEGIVLSRTDFQEADRILTVLTPDQGKVRLIAKGVRKIKSKLAGGIELFSVSQITFVLGRSEIKTLISSRLQTHFADITKDVNRTMLGYEFLKRINKVTEDAAESSYFELLLASLKGLDDSALPVDVVDFWFSVQLLKITGHAPNLRTTSQGQPLLAKAMYHFDYDRMTFEASPIGTLTTNHIKLMRLGTNSSSPSIFLKVQGSTRLIPELLELSQTLLKSQVRI